MCDTLIALGNSTKDGSVIFGKNSDRPQEEVQLITHVPRSTHSKEEELKCTHITIPQVSETAAIILSQPWWMWGAEMGSNEYGVTIGNEAVHTYEPLRKNGLLGMDLLRLGLERGKTAKDALMIITRLLMQYHQGGACSYEDSGWMYHNSFLIADLEKAYVLETADDWWVAEQVEDMRSISNELSIRGWGDLRREGIIQHAVEKGYCKDDGDFDFAITFSEFDPLQYFNFRQDQSARLLARNRGKITPGMMMDFLRDHRGGLCIHGGFETTGSQVSHLRKLNESIHWFTGSKFPCMSLYRPFIIPIEKQVESKPGPYPSINPEWFWCQHAKKIDRFERNPILSGKDLYLKSLISLQKSTLSSVNNAIKNDDKKTFSRNIMNINFSAENYFKEFILK